ncbi:TPA: ead/Ea22-like family protein [Klebsiella pneumoniae]|nr:ead/Ea22-like family protein [Klebsiella pneumoniae]
MTDITELAQRMKAATEKATPGPWYVHDKPCEDGNYGIDTSDKEFLAEAVVWWGFARQSIWREEDAKYIALANPANILALVEALESEKRICATWRKIAESTGEKLEKAQQRTVTFKLPFTPEPSAYSPWVAKAFYQFHRDTVKSCFAVFSDACAAAGIKVEVE